MLSCTLRLQGLSGRENAGGAGPQRTHNVYVGSERSQVVVRQLVDHISSAQNMLDFPGLEECLEFLG